MNPLDYLEKMSNETEVIINLLGEITSPLSVENELINIEKLLNKRSQDIEAFFSCFNVQQLETLQHELNAFLIQDIQLITLSNQVKSSMAKQLIKQKKTKKAANLYQNK